jgi:hypothetical protein
VPQTVRAGCCGSFAGRFWTVKLPSIATLRPMLKMLAEEIWALPKTCADGPSVSFRRSYRGSVKGAVKIDAYAVDRQTPLDLAGARKGTMLAVGYSHIRPFDDAHDGSGAEGRAVVTALPRLSSFLTWIGVHKRQRWALASNGVRRARQGRCSATRMEARCQ